MLRAGRRNCQAQRQAAASCDPSAARLSGDGRHHDVYSSWLGTSAQVYGHSWQTSVLSGAEMRQLLKAIDTAELVGRRDRALLGLMGYTFARVSVVIPSG